MKRMTFTVMVTVIAMAFVSCDSGGSDPEKVYLTGSDTFTRVDAAGTLAITAIYQYDGEGEFYTGEDSPVTFDASVDDIWTVTADGVTYLADAWLSPTKFENKDPDSGVVLSTIEFDDSGNGIMIGDTNYADSSLNIIYKGNGSITINGFRYTAQ